MQLAHSCKEREASVPHHAAGAEGAIALAAWQPPERAVLEHAEERAVVANCVASHSKAISRSLTKNRTLCDGNSDPNERSKGG